MKITTQYLRMVPCALWQGLVEAQLKRLEKLARIGVAHVILDRPERGHVFRVKTTLEVPGPDFHAEATDRTLAAALRKVVKNLEQQIRIRNDRRAENRKSNLQLGIMPSRSLSFCR